MLDAKETITIRHCPAWGYNFFWKVCFVVTSLEIRKPTV